MTTQYRWEFGFDFNAAPDSTKVGLNPDPTNGAPICLLQNGLCKKTSTGVAPAWPSRLLAGDSIEFRIFDLTSLQGTPVGSTSISQHDFSIVNPKTGDPEYIFVGAPFSGQALVPVAGGLVPTVWPSDGVSVPAWNLEVNSGQINAKTYLPLGTGVPFATLSILLQIQLVSDPSNSKWFGLDPEMWVRDG